MHCLGNINEYNCPPEACEVNHKHVETSIFCNSPACGSSPVTDLCCLVLPPGIITATFVSAPTVFFSLKSEMFKESVTLGVEKGDSSHPSSLTLNDYYYFFFIKRIKGPVWIMCVLI